jgi:hypothetical protein
MSFDKNYPLKDYLNSINHVKNNLLETEDKGWEKNYPPFIINKCLANFIDTIMHVNEMNVKYHIDKKLHYDYLLNSVRKNKRFSPWSKKETEDDVLIIQEYFGYSQDKAKSALKLLNRQQIDLIKKKLYRGGKT